MPGNDRRTGISLRSVGDVRSQLRRTHQLLLPHHGDVYPQRQDRRLLRHVRIRQLLRRRPGRSRFRAQHRRGHDRVSERPKTHLQQHADRIVLGILHRVHPRRSRRRCRRQFRQAQLGETQDSGTLVVGRSGPERGRAAHPARGGQLLRTRRRPRKLLRNGVPFRTDRRRPRIPLRGRLLQGRFRQKGDILLAPVFLVARQCLRRRLRRLLLRLEKQHGFGSERRRILLLRRHVLGRFDGKRNLRSDLHGLRCRRRSRRPGLLHGDPARGDTRRNAPADTFGI